MEKTTIKAPFTDWENSRSGNDYIKRYGQNGDKTSIAVRLGRNDVFMANTSGSLYHGTSLGDAVEWADNYIADNFEVEKPVEERLKDAEAEIVTLKAKVAEMENPLPGKQPKFKVGQVVRGTGKQRCYKEPRPITKVALVRGIYMYSRDTATSPALIFKEDELELA